MGGGKQLNIRVMTLGQLGVFTRGSGLQKKDFTPSGTGCIHYGQIYTHYGTTATKTKSFVSPDFARKARKARRGDLVIATTSENDEDLCKAVAWLGDEDVAVSSDACFYSHSLDPAYVAITSRPKCSKNRKEDISQAPKSGASTPRTSPR